MYVVFIWSLNLRHGAKKPHGLWRPAAIDHFERVCSLWNLMPHGKVQADAHDGDATVTSLSHRVWRFVEVIKMPGRPARAGRPASGRPANAAILWSSVGDRGVSHLFCVAHLSEINHALVFTYICIYLCVNVYVWLCAWGQSSNILRILINWPSTRRKVRAAAVWHRLSPTKVVGQRDDCKMQLNATKTHDFGGAINFH